jgi:hypothetical protein
LKYETQREEERETDREREVMNSSRRFGKGEREGQSESRCRTRGERTLLFSKFPDVYCSFFEGSLKKEERLRRSKVLYRLAEF